jgi:hypothetical protein
VQDLRQTIDSGRSPFERLVQRIPGFRGYFGRENRRQADDELREFGVSRLERMVSDLHAIVKDLPLDRIDEMRQVILQAETLRNELRYADQGYSGFFSEIKWDSEELLDAIYARDEQIVESLISLCTVIEEGEFSPPDVRRELRSLSRSVADRKTAILGLVPDSSAESEPSGAGE